MTDQIATATLVDNIFIELTFLRENITLGVNEVADGWAKAQKLSPDKKYAVLLKTGRLTLLEKEARDYVLNELKIWPFVAIVVDNLGQRIMGQVIINMTGKGSHIKIFEKEAKAKEWLLGKVYENKFAPNAQV
ncbi:MAG: hypothetical protein ACKVOR_07185 [Flavobacteriales bacterium]